MTPQCEMHDNFEKTVTLLHKKLDMIIDRLGKGDIDIATLALRVKTLERIVYGAVGATLLAVLAGILALVVR